MTNKMKHIKFALPLLAISLLGTTACTGNFEEINKDPNGLEETQVNVTSRFNQPVQSVYLNYQNKNFEYQLVQNLNADMYSGYMATGTAFNGNSNNATYVLQDSWNEQPLKIGMLNIMKPISIILKSTEAKDYTAIAKIIRVAGIHKVVDIYGPTPYSQAMQGGASVPYDDVETLYTTFLSELEEAVNDLTTLVDSGEAESSRLAAFDKVCGQDFKQWIRFGNTLRLRLAMRMAVVKPDLAKSTAEAAVNHKYGVLVAGNPNVELIDATLQNPLNEVSLGYNDMRAGASLVSILEGYEDPRLPIYVKAVGWFKDQNGKASDIVDKSGKPTNSIGKYIGIRQGTIVDSKDNYQVFSTMNMSTETKLSDYTGNNTQLSNHLPWMKVAEAYFLRAEGALRGWNMGGTAKDLYEQGIKVSFDDYAISAEAYSAYINNATGVGKDYVDPHNPDNNHAGVDKCTVKWDEGASNEEKLHKIINQKWLAMYPDGQEAWSEFRRTGYPKLFPVVNNMSSGDWTIPQGEFIKRLPFAKCDRDNNADAVKEATQLLGGPDSPATRIWWDTGKNF